MLPTLGRRLNRLERHRAALLARIAPLSPEQLVTRTSPERWHVLDVVEHLIIIEEMVLRALATRPARSRSPRGCKVAFGCRRCGFISGAGESSRRPPARSSRGAMSPSPSCGRGGTALAPATAPPWNPSTAPTWSAR